MLKAGEIIPLLTPYEEPMIVIEGDDSGASRDDYSKDVPPDDQTHVDDWFRNVVKKGSIPT